MMKCREKFLLSALALCGVANVNAGCGATPYYSIRSQGVNTVREMVGWERLINRCGKEEYNGAAALALEYSQSFRSGNICECLFGDSLRSNTNGTTSGCNTNCNTNCNDSCKDCSIRISGSCVDDRNETRDWLADYFGLPTDFDSVVRFSPRIRNFVADLQFYFGADRCAEGLYARLHLPITTTRWTLGFCEGVVDAGSNALLPGYFTADTLPRSALLQNATQFFSGLQTPAINTGQGSDFQTVFQPLRYGRWAANNCDCSSLSKTRLADVEGVIGYNFVCDEDYYFGLNLRSEAPTGNRPEGVYLFEPIVGNGHHWTLGGGLNAHAVLWRSCECDSTFSFYIDANIVHFFKACQTRTFDLCSAGPNSRYMLAQRLGENEDTIFGGTTESNSQFAGEFAPVANLTASQVEVGVSVQGDVSLLFNYESDCGFNWGIGYNFWGRACENICRKGGCNNIDITQWALKGDAFVYGFGGTDDEDPFALAATQSAANIHTGRNFVNTPSCTTSEGTASGAYLDAINATIDGRQLASVNNVDLLYSQPAEGTVRAATSIQPETLTLADINLVGTRGISHKLFTDFNYTWLDRDSCWTPFLGIGASVEFAQNCGSCNDDCNTGCSTTASNCNTGCNTNCDSNNDCQKCALSQWAVWIKGGVAY